MHDRTNRCYSERGYRTMPILFQRNSSPSDYHLFASAEAKSLAATNVKTVSNVETWDMMTGTTRHGLTSAGNRKAGSMMSRMPELRHRLCGLDVGRHNSELRTAVVFITAEKRRHPNTRIVKPTVWTSMPLTSIHNYYYYYYYYY